MIYLMLFLLSFALTFLIMHISIKKSLVDIPNERSSHSMPTPHGGGIAVAVTWFLGISYLYYINDIESHLYFALLAGTIISIVSYFDDLFDISPKIRLLAQGLTAFLGLYFLGGLGKIDFVIYTFDNPIITNIFGFFMIIWFINLYNFLDGIDGYAGSEAVFLGVSGFVLFGHNLFIILIVAVSGFLIWNWHKAKIFMGDVGSTLLGYNIALFAIYYGNDGTSILVWIVLFGLFWFDATLTLFRRYRNGERLSQAHKKHAYQRLVQSGWTHDKVVKYGIVVNLILLVFIYFISNIFIVFLISLILLYGIVKFVDSKKGFIK